MRTRRTALIVLFAVFGTLLAPSSITPARADGTPDVFLSKTVPAEALLGADIPVTLTLTNPTGPDGYNVSFAETLPAGVSYVGGSSTPEPLVLPQGDGTTVLLWSNVADMITGATVTLDFSIVTGSGFEPGDSVITNSGAYTNSNARAVPDFDPTTGIAIGDFTGSDTTSRSTRMLAFEVTKTEPSEESELLRGVHDHQTVMTLTVDNNFLNATSDVAIIDYLPAELEYLGCGGTDNSTGGDEHPGSGPINPGNEPVMSNPCIAPSGITTVNLDPDGLGPAASDIYTRLTWNAASLATTIPAGGAFALDYLAAVPMQENAQISVPDLTANLDNNGGALTTESEDALEGHVVATGTYTGNGSPATATDYPELFAEDLSIHKSVDLAVINQGDTPTFTLEIESSEYAASTDTIVVTDTLPAALDLTGSAPATTSSVLQPDGSTLVTWSLPGFTAPNSTTTITVNTLARTTYRNGDGTDGAPFVSNDELLNTVDLSADVTVITSSAGATTVVPLDDTSSATLAASGPSITKEVSTPVGGILTCGDGTGVTFSTATASSYRPGDRVCFRLTTDFPSLLDTLGPTITDLLPAGFALESWTTGASSDVVASGLTFTDNAPHLMWELGDQDAGGVHVEIVLSTIVDTPDAAADGDIVDNLMKLRYPNTAGEVFQLRTAALSEWSEANLDLTKGVALLNGAAVPSAPADSVTVEEGDLVTFQLDVTNSGSVPALDTEIRDILPDEVSCTDVSSITNGGICDGTNGWIDWPASADIDIGPGGSVSLTYVLTIPIGVSAGASLTNIGGVRSYSGDTNTGTPFTYTPADNIDPALTANTTAADDDSEVVTTLPTIVKSVSTSITEAGNDTASEAAIGETVSYTIDVSLPDAISYYNTSVVDALTPDMDLLEGSVSATLDGASLPAGFTMVADDPTNTVTVTFPTPYSVPDGIDQALQIQLDAQVLDTATNSRGSTSTNTAELRFEDVSGTARSVSDGADIDIVEPNLTVRKQNDDLDGKVVAGQIVTYTIEVENPATGRVSVGHETVLVDIVPDELLVLEGPGDPAEDGDVIAPDGGLWDASARSITWDLGAVDPAASLSLSYDIQIGNPLVASGTLRNTAEATTSSLAGTPTIERDHNSPNGNADGQGYQDSDDSTVSVPALDIVKSVSSLTATVGQALTYTLIVELPEAVIAYDVTVIDDLPPGLVYESMTSISCDQGGSACAPDITTVDEIEGAGDVAFFFGDLASEASADRTVTIDYVVVVDDVVEADDGSSLLNTATVHWNDVDTIAGTPGALPDPSSFSDASGPWSVAVSTNEPALSINKDVVGQTADDDQLRAKPGDTLSFTVEVTNTGSSSAYDATVTDVATDDSWTFTDTTGASGVTNTDADPVGGLSWLIGGPIAPGDSVTITYDLVVSPLLGPANEVAAGVEVTNTADVSPYYGIAAATRTANPGRPYRSYDDVTTDEVGLELDLASLGDAVWFDADGDGVVDPGEPGLPDIDVLVTYLGIDGAPGGGDDETVTVTTASDGSYTAERLPAGTYVVDVDETDPDFPSGLVPTYDLDGTTITPNGSWTGVLAEDDQRTDVDFGYAGTGSIGDTVWFDQNRDGVVGGPEGPLANVDLTVTWLGQDAVIGGGDDVDFAATTDASGDYRVEGLPAGSYAVVVDVTTIPAGFVNVADPGGENDNAALLTLTDGQADLDQDFGYAGTDLIGDLVWLDQNDDGTRDPGEPGLAGVIVELTYFGVDGVLGGLDDATFTTTTDGVGFYEFLDLPPGAFEVVVTGGLPANTTNTFDPDTGGSGDARSTFTLPGGTADLDQDFGFGASSVVGDRVWWDTDRDGIQDLGEPGLNGVEVTATYFGPDDTLGTLDDQVFTTMTSGDGDYLFSDVSDGSYTLSITSGIPNGFDPVFDDDSGTTSPDETTDFVLTTAHLTADFGYAGTASIGDTVWLDTDRSGTFDTGEIGLEGVDITLTWFGPDGIPNGGDDLELSTQTAADGTYLFTTLPAGNFETVVDPTTLPAGLESTFDPDTGTVTPDGESALAVAVGEVVTDHDYGFAGTSSIGGRVWFDRDGDGVIGADEPGLGGVGVDLEWTTVFGPQTFSTITDVDGDYMFENVPTGAVIVDVDEGSLPGSVTATFDLDGGLDGRSAATLIAGATNLDHDFGYRGDASIGDLVWLDLDGDGVSTPGEPGVPAQSVELTWQFPAGPISWTTTTDADGAYGFDSLADGDYVITIVGGVAALADNTGDPGGDADSTNNLTISSGASDLNQDFGYRGQNTVGDLVWADSDRDGMFDAGEQPLENIMVGATWHGPDDVVGTSDDVRLPTATTDALGQYTLPGLPDGNYTLIVESGLPPGVDEPSYDLDDGTTDPNGASILTDLGAGAGPEVDLDVDFGFSGRGRIGDTVWLNLDGDDTRDGNEPGLEGITVTVIDAGPDGVLSTGDDVTLPAVSTDSTGFYLFEHLSPGLYDVRYRESDLPAGARPQVDADGGDATAAMVTLLPDEERLDVDFGAVGTSALEGTVFVDANADGTPQASEATIENVTVTIRWTGPDGPIDFTVQTAADGSWELTDLPAGDYLVVLGLPTIPAGLVPNDPVVTELTLVPGGTEVANNGLVAATSIGDLVWHDDDRNGVVSEGEVGVEAVRVNLSNDAGDVIESTLTEVDGSYLFTELAPGSYTVELDEQTIPEGMTVVFDPDVIDGEVPNSMAVTEIEAGTDDLTIDFGLDDENSSAGPAALAFSGRTIGDTLLVGGLLVWFGMMLTESAKPRRRLVEQLEISEDGRAVVI